MFSVRENSLYYQHIPFPSVKQNLRYLVEQLRLPAYCLVDSDPYGFDILATYKFGSMVGPNNYLMFTYFRLLISYLC